MPRGEVAGISEFCNKNEKEWERMPKSTDIKPEKVKQYLSGINDTAIQTVAEKITEIYRNNQNNPTRNNSYKNSYNSLIKQGDKCGGNKKGKDRVDELVILAHAAYGWMPTILEIECDFGDKDKKKILDAVDGLSSFDSSSCDEKIFENLKTVAAFTNNSFVGASKFLHFIYPKKFAIWDSKIFGVLRNSVPPNFFAVQNANDMRNFIGYQLAMQEAKDKLKVELRDIESVLFDSAKDRPSTSDDE